MAFSLEEVLKTYRGSLILSIILGFGIAAMFRKVCNGNNCIVLKGIEPNKIKGNIYKWHDECYKYNKINTSCEDKKKLIKQENK